MSITKDDILFFNESDLSRNYDLNTLPKFNRSDLKIGQELGRGQFSIVSEITNIKAPSMITETSKNQSSKEGNISRDKLDEILFMSRDCMRHGIAKYVMKRTNPALDKEKLADSIMDLALESKILSTLSHPHIIDIRGTGLYPNQDSFFIVLDRIYFTLPQKLERWSDTVPRNASFIGKRSTATICKVRQLWRERLLVAYQISLVLHYLHIHGIIFRDLKPENIGFDQHDDVKLFDFGLAKELLKDDYVGNDLYELSGLAGSQRYMAPEVVLCKPYNEKADVYSFGILLWQISALKMPFAGYNSAKHTRRVVHQQERPKLESSWPLSFRNLIKKCWSPTINTRPYFETIRTIVGDEATRYGACISDECTLDTSTHERNHDIG